MNITFVAKKNIHERYKIFEFKNKEDNPFFGDFNPGQPIWVDNLAKIAASSPVSPQRRALRQFILDAILDGYRDIRYYYS